VLRAKNKNGVWGHFYVFQKNKGECDEGKMVDDENAVLYTRTDPVPDHNNQYYVPRFDFGYEYMLKYDKNVLKKVDADDIFEFDGKFVYLKKNVGGNWKIKSVDETLKPAPSKHYQGWRNLKSKF